jgi:hypothetical protein
MTLAPGTRVRLVTPDNPRLHGAAGEVAEVTPYGAVVRTAAAATGRFRALAAELVPDGANGCGPVVVPCGEVCSRCGSPNMTRAGSCLVCRECGDTSGGCS